MQGRQSTDLARKRPNEVIIGEFPIIGKEDETGYSDDEKAHTRKSG